MTLQALATVRGPEPEPAEPDDLEILALIGKALRRADISQKAAAIWCDVADSQFSRAFNGQAAFNVRWLWKLPAPFWNELTPLLRAAKETTPEARQQQRKERLVQAIELLIVACDDRDDRRGAR